MNFRNIFIAVSLLIVIIVGVTQLRSKPTVDISFTADDSTLRSLGQGDVVGGIDRGVSHAWLGIPYAQAPTNNLRWKAPRPVQNHKGLLKATSIPPVCMQYGSSLSDTGEGFEAGAPTGSEDCLFLSIWAPVEAENLPVMFWIHGGSNRSGTGGAYNGAHLAAGKDVIVVSINYRLGLFGWFSHHSLKNGDPLDDSGNYGLLDAIEALRWVQANIQAFGGNPKNVTIFGESAGAFNVLALMASQKAEGLFHNAVSQSGGLNPRSMLEAENLKDNGGHHGSSAELLNRLFMADNTVTTREEAIKHQRSSPPEQLQAYLLQKSAIQILEDFKGDGNAPSTMPTLLADGYVIPKMSNKEIFSNPNNHTMVPIILGTNRDENALWMVQNPEHINYLFGVLPRVRDKSAYARYVKYGGLAWKLRGVDDLARFMTEAGNDSVYTYRFDWDEQPSQFGFDMSFALGAAHGLEIPFVFGNFASGIGSLNVYPQDEAQMALSQSMSSYWSQFAHSSDPGKGRNGQEKLWSPWSKNGHYSIILDTVQDKGIRMSKEQVTMASLKKSFIEDNGFDDPLDKCKLYVQTFRDEHFDETQYASLNDTCSTRPAHSLSAE